MFLPVAKTLDVGATLHSNITTDDNFHRLAVISITRGSNTTIL
jgi:hypothetical protein